MYTTLLFDIDDTLLDFKMAEKVAISKTLENIGLTPTDEIVKNYSDINAALWEKYQKKEITKARLVIKRFEEFFALYNLDLNAEEVNQNYFENVAQGYFEIEGAKETLAELNEKYESYAVTNATLWISTARLKGSGFYTMFKKIFNSEEIGASKPNKEFFDVVFKNINEKDKSKILIIGDSLTSDILGGINAGIDTCWINPKGKTTDLKVTYTLKSVTELLNIL